MVKLISVIVPCRNEEKYIQRFLSSLLLQKIASGYSLEIIIADGSSDDKTIFLIKEFQEKYDNIILLDNPQRYVTFGLNHCLRAAKGSIIIRMDVHSEYPSDYIFRCVNMLEEGKGDVVGGRFQNSLLPENTTNVALAIGQILHNPFGVGNSPFRTQSVPGYVDSVPYGVFYKSLIDKIGLFNEKLAIGNEDNEFFQRVAKIGGKIFMDPDIAIKYYYRHTLSGLLKQAVRNGYWCCISSCLNIRNVRARHFAPLGFVVYVLFGLFLLFYKKKQCAIGKIAYWGIYFCPAAYFSIISRQYEKQLQGGWQVVFLAFLILPIFHFAYGLGWVKGFLALASRTSPMQQQ